MSEPSTAHKTEPTTDVSNEEAQVAVSTSAEFVQAAEAPDTSPAAEGTDSTSSKTAMSDADLESLQEALNAATEDAAAEAAAAEAAATEAAAIEAASIEAVADAAAPAAVESIADAEPKAVVAADPADTAAASAKATTETAGEKSPVAEGETQPDAAAAGVEAGGDDATAPELPVDPALAPIIVAMETKAPIEGKVIGWNKGGYHVALGQIAAFCPVSQIEVGNPRAPKRYLDRTLKFVVIDVAKDGRRVVVSRAEALKVERKEKAAKVRESLKIGSVFEGKIRSVTEFGAFVRLQDGIEGLVHVSEISRRRVEHPKELVKVGQSVKVKVLKIEKGGERISLSMKRLEADPWKTLNERLPVGEAFTGTIKRKAEFGLFIEVEPGIEGLVHTSRLPLGKTMGDESLGEGKVVEGWVQEIEARRRRLALSLRPIPNARVWEGVDERYPVGSMIEGTVERVADFGAFIELEPGLTGLLPFSELRGDGGGGTSGGVNFKRQYHAGKKVRVRVLSIEAGRQRISLGTEGSKAVGTQADYRDFKKQQHSTDGLGAMAAAFARLRDD